MNYNEARTLKDMHTQKWYLPASSTFSQKGFHYPNYTYYYTPFDYIVLQSDLLKELLC